MNISSYTYLSTYARRGIHLLRQRWPNIDKHFNERDIDVDRINSEMTCTPEDLNAVMDLLVDKMGVSASFLFAREIRLSYMGPAAAVMLSAPNVQAALAWAVRVTNNESGTRVKMFVINGDAELTWEMDKNLTAGCRECAIMATAKIASEILAQGCDGVPIRKCVLTLPTDCVVAADLISGALNNITINWCGTSKEMGLHVPAAFLKQRLINSDELVYKVSKEYAELFFDSITAKDNKSYTRTVIDTVRQMDPLDVDLKSTAKEIGQSETAFKDRLRTEGSTFTEARNEAWMQIALRLAEGGASRVDAADHFGKSSANFGEWFKAHHPAGKSYSDIKNLV
jgi:AraC-like DNA-binding protein